MTANQPTQVSTALSRDEQVVRLQRELLDLQRRAALGDLTAALAHEYNNLLTPIVIRTQDALQRADALALHNAAQRTLDQCERAQQLSNQILRLARSEPLELQDCTLAAALATALGCMVRPFEKDRVDFSAEIPPDLTVRATPVLLEQLLINLLLDARQALQPRGGRLAIRADRSGDSVVLTVRDNGRRFSSAQIDQQLNPFLASTPADAPCDWAQLGPSLNACRLIAQYHNAQLTAEPAEPVGVTFRLVWPAA